jgi:heme exporter protein CcmD
MLEWLESHGHWGFITASYAIAALALLVDVLGQRIKRNDLKRRVLERQARRRLQRTH